MTAEETVIFSAMVYTRREVACYAQFTCQIELLRYLCQVFCTSTFRERSVEGRSVSRGTAKERRAIPARFYSRLQLKNTLSGVSFWN